MVLIANKKTSGQMKDDLSLFVGDNVDQFVDWLHFCLDEIKMGNDPFVKPIVPEVFAKKETPASKESTHTEVVHKETAHKESAYKDTAYKEEPISKASQSRSESTSSVHNTKATGPLKSLTSNEESKENSKQKPARKLITFFSEDKSEPRRVEPRRVEPRRAEQQQSTAKEQPEERPKNVHKRIVYDSQAVQSELPVKKFKNELPPKSVVLDTSRSRNEPLRGELLRGQPARAEPIRRELARNDSVRREPVRSSMATRSTDQPNAHSAVSVSSRIAARESREPQVTNYKQQQPSNLESNLRSNQYRRSYGNQQPNSPPSQYGQQQQQHSNNSHPDQYEQNGSASENQKYNHPVDQLKRTNQSDTPRQAGDLRQRLSGKMELPKSVETPTKPKPLLFRAIAEANKSSALAPISKRKPDPDKPKATLVERLGLAGSLPADREETKKEPAKANKLECDEEAKLKRQIKFNQRGAVAAKQLVQQAVKQAAQQAGQLPSQAERPAVEFEDEKSISKLQEENLKKEDLRDQLSRKRKLNDGDSPGQSLGQVAKRSPAHKPIRKEDDLVQVHTAKRTEDSDDELKALKDKIRPKSQVASQVKSQVKPQVLVESRTDDNQKETTGEDMKLFLKQELIRKMNAIEAQISEQKNRMRQSGKELSTKKERCRYWPVCSNDNCQFHHPTSICK